jgi:hypothetical protein
MKRSVTVQLSEFSARALAGKEEDGSEYAPGRLARAIRVYLREGRSGRPGWSVPTALRREDPGGVELELVADEDLLRAFEQEADRQGVSVSRLAAQAVVYYAAEMDGGRITQRILDDLDGNEAPGAAG